MSNIKLLYFPILLIIFAILAGCNHSDSDESEPSTTISGQLITNADSDESSTICPSTAVKILVLQDGDTVSQAEIAQGCDFTVDIPAETPVSLKFVDASESDVGVVIYENPRISQGGTLEEFIDRFQLPLGANEDIGNVLLLPDQEIALLQRNPLLYQDRDGDGVADGMDADFNLSVLLSNQDIDNDSIDNESDNCPYESNPDQEDTDQDGLGDACSIPLDMPLYGQLTLSLVKKLATEEEVQAIMDDPALLDSTLLEVSEDDPNTIVFGPIPQKGNWIVTQNQKVMIDPDGFFTLDPVTDPGSGLAVVVREVTDEKPLFTFPLHKLSTDASNPAVIDIKGTFPRPCGMDGDVCHNPAIAEKGGAVHHINHGHIHLPPIRPFEEQGDEGVSGNCKEDYNTYPCCLDYDGPLAGPDAEPQTDSVTEVQVYLGSTCHESVLHNCCTNERGDFAYRAVEILRIFSDSIDELYEPIGCHDNHKKRNCQWIDYDTEQRGLYLSETAPSIIQRSARYQENTRPQTGSLYVENIVVACGQEKTLYMYNNTCRNESVIHFERNIGGSAKLNGDGVENEREIPANERANPLVVKHYKDGVDNFIFQRSITYTAPSEAGSADAISVQAGGIHRRVNIEVVCEDTVIEDPPPEEEEEVTEPPPPTTNPEIDVVEQTAFIFDHYIGESPCPQEIGQLNIGNSGDGTLTWRIEHTIPWLDVAPASGIAPSTVSLRFNCNVSGPGNLSGSFSIVSDNAINSPLSIPVGGTVH
ncbi:MAG: thrombospondin type 3 repeat-containing protein [Candidatus Thiodiazotropha weberae]|nr:thrombospondin type 3 repeat-containing protein [Candidatus Thiodiazotropha lotti]MCG7985815.1 thrombospondin type 3 repeat-containing protein [Candidatus Thiodiazotropha lotti]MCG8012479.1 thrombospondin type 3 repeat-containing protein [Candidatus Thiodiazotropha lotti]MCG8022109.1 thrombospondin type 3 repeat-containing protein [Candidatus Thiodiazotropha lotti]MCW4209282.1 thrombospondin type 3 repeat-containing protein [Candidatus Thiodiazotropha lotti]